MEVLEFSADYLRKTKRQRLRELRELAEGIH
jgi:hypothetical protein